MGVYGGLWREIWRNLWEEVVFDATGYCCAMFIVVAIGGGVRLGSRGCESWFARGKRRR